MFWPCIICIFFWHGITTGNYQGMFLFFYFSIFYMKNVPHWKDNDKGPPMSFSLLHNRHPQTHINT
ncbi:hypothetical protein HanRHA438_Chr04g0192751 [Helianthus annuus]|uniref:Uncharacterized protein n=1 Tax=Helianthus annuus TaxID=4232 RepID=A0A251RLW6_HELAN|nr:hypothetical protein HanRHA438_Chr04g0192751 [Helianthus annuus]